MPREETLQKLAPALLRGGLVFLFIWFGVSQVLSPDEWISWVPLWVPNLLNIDARLVVLLNGGFEVVGGILLLCGVYVRFVATLLGLHLLVIAYEVGYNDIGIRDLALAVATFSLALFNGDSWTLQRKSSPQQIA